MSESVGALGPELGAALRFFWGDTQLDEFFLHPGRPSRFSVGSAADVSFTLGDSALGAESFEVIRGDADGFRVRFPRAVHGALLRDGDRRLLQTLIRDGDVEPEDGAYALALEAGDCLRLSLGHLDLELSRTAVPRAARTRLLDAVDFTALNAFLAAFFIAGLALIGVMNRAAEGEPLRDELEVARQPVLAKLLVPERPPPPALVKTEKRVGPTKRTPRPGSRPRGTKSAEAIVERIFSGPGALRSLFADRGMSSTLAVALREVGSTSVGDSTGVGGLHLRGTGSPSGGDPVGIGEVGTRGRNDPTYGVAVLGSKKEATIAIASEESVVGEPMDRELIRRVIRGHVDQVRYCYELELPRFPRLAGKVAVKFVITAAGTVASASVADSSVHDAELEACVMARVRTWVFPKPRGGGATIVTYPFVFKQSGE